MFREEYLSVWWEKLYSSDKLDQLNIYKVNIEFIEVFSV